MPPHAAVGGMIFGRVASPSPMKEAGRGKPNNRAGVVSEIFIDETEIETETETEPHLLLSGYAPTPRITSFMLSFFFYSFFFEAKKK